MKEAEKLIIRRVAATMLSLLCILVLCIAPAVGYTGKTREGMKQIRLGMMVIDIDPDYIDQFANDYHYSRETAKLIMTLLKHVGKPDLSFSDLRSAVSLLTSMKDEDQAVAGKPSGLGLIDFFLGEGGTGGSRVALLSVVFNLLFFGTLLSALFAAFCCLMNYPWGGVIPLFAFACLCSGMSLHLVIHVEEANGSSLFPHLATFLLPGLAFAACLTYCRDTEGVVRQYFLERRAKTMPAVEGPDEPVEPAAEPIGPAGPSPDEAQTDKKEQKRAFAFCPYCGEKLTPGFAFCPFCGAKMN